MPRHRRERGQIAVAALPLVAEGSAQLLARRVHHAFVVLVLGCRDNCFSQKFGTDFQQGWQVVRGYHPVRYAALR